MRSYGVVESGTAVQFMSICSLGPGFLGQLDSRQTSLDMKSAFLSHAVYILAIFAEEKLVP
jgi:hypothetical protein